MRHNLAAARERARGRSVWAVVKANAYGHGIESAVRAFAAADGLALLDLEEARRARAAGWTRPILLLEGVFEPGDVAACRALGLTVALHHDEQIRMFETAPAGLPIGVHVKLNTGMNRLGFDVADLPAVLDRLGTLPAVRIEALSMHFANADRRDQRIAPVAMVQQLANFEGACSTFDIPRSLSNSAALFLHPALAEAAVRPGIALYGATPDDRHPAAELGLRAAMTLSSRLISVRSLAAGEGVGYGSRFVAERSTRIGVVACGYADGYPRNAPDGTPVMVGGVRAPLAGRVSMDMITVDLGAAPDATIGTPVELWGGVLPIDEVAAHCGTVGYELMCALASRVPVEVTG